MRLRAGTWPWLLAHEVRLAWRGVITGNADLILAVLLIVWLLLHVPAYILMQRVTPDLLAGFGIAVAGLFFWFGITLMLSTAIVLSVNALYDRGDLDLLLSSPLQSSTVFTVRGIGVALSSVFLFAALLLPFAHMGIYHGQFGFVAVYPLLIGVSLGAAGAAFALTLLLARTFGARKARVAGQLLSALVGASLFFVLQTPNLLPDEVRASLMPKLLELLTTGWLGGDSPVWWPVRAVFGDPLSLVATVGVGVGLFVFVVRLTGRAFVSGTQESTTRPSRRTGTSKAARFQQGLRRNVMRKELRLIARDPNLIAKTLLQTLYLLPMLFILLRNSELLDVLAPAIIVLMSGVAGNLAWITISGEESPDLIGSAPVNRESVRWFKAAAALKPIAIVSVPFVGFYLFYAPALALVFVAYLAVALVGAAMTQVWGGKPSPKRDLKQRQKQNMGLNFVELLSTVALAGACYLTFNPSWWAFALVPVGLLAPGLAWTMRQRD